MSIQKTSEELKIPLAGPVNSKFPPFLTLLFFVDMWERFSYYGMRALLVLFLTSELGFSDAKAYGIYSLFAALSYMGPVLGGILADKLIGFRNMVLLGGIVLTAGHALMFLEDIDTMFLYLGLGTIAVGVGFFKGNIANLLGDCYEINDPERDRGFTMLYVSVNLGSALASLLCALVAKIYGWNYGFGLAGIGMALGLVTYVRYQHILGDVGLPSPDKQKAIWGFKPFKAVLLLAGFLSVVAAYMLYYSELFSQIITVIGLLVFSYTGRIIYQMQGMQRMRLIVLCLFLFFTMAFYALEMQLGSLINLFTQRNVNKMLFGFEVPAAFSQAINPLSIMIAGPFFAEFFATRTQDWTIKKFSCGLFLMVMSFAVLYIGCLFADSAGQVSYAMLIIAIAFMGIGEIFIAPLIYNLCTTLTPVNLRGFIMGVQMLAIAFSNLGGYIIRMFMSVPTQNGSKSDPLVSLDIYQSGFLKIMIFNIIIWLLFLSLSPLIRKVLEDKRI